MCAASVAGVPARAQLLMLLHFAKIGIDSGMYNETCSTFFSLVPGAKKKIYFEIVHFWLVENWLVKAALSQHVRQGLAYVHAFFECSRVKHAKKGQQLEKIKNVATYSSISLLHGCFLKNSLEYLKLSSWGIALCKIGLTGLTVFSAVSK